MEKYVKTFEGTEPAPASDDVEWYSILLTFPMDVMRNVVAPEILDMSAECGGSIGVIHSLSHVSAMSCLEPNCATSVGLSGVSV